MAKLIAGAAGVNFDDLLVGDLLLGDVTLATPTAFTLQDGPWRDEFRGQFTYANDSISGGVVTAWTQSLSGQLIFDVSEFSVAATTFVTWAATGNNESAKSTILGGADLIIGSAVADRMRGYAGDDVIQGGGGLDHLRGDEGNDSISGGDGFDDVHGNMGSDTVAGGAGGDWVVGGQNNDVLFGDDGDDVVYGNLGADTQNGGTGADWVRGGQDDDVLNGDAGDDWMSGDRGADTLSGGAGADIFNIFAQAGSDRVLDFNRAEGDRVKVEPGSTYAASQVGGDVVIDLSGARMTLVNVNLANLDEGWIYVG